MSNLRLLHNLKLKTQLMLIYLFTILLPVIILTQVVIYISGQKIIQQTTQISQETSRQLNRNIRELFNKYIDISYRITYYDDVLKNYLNITMDYGSVLDSIDAYNNYLKQLNYYGVYGSNSEAFLKVYFLNKTLLPDSNTFFFADESVQKSEPYKRAVKSNGELVWGYLKDSHRIFLSLRFLDDQSNYAGVISIEIPDSKIFSLISEIDLREKEITICDSNALVISSNNRSLLGTSIKDQGFFKKAKNIKDGIFEINEHGNFQVISESVKSAKGLPDWFIITRIPLDNLLSDANSIRNISLLICIISVATSSILFIIFLDRITSRIKKLVSNMKKVKEGKFTTLANTGSNDEIGEVIENFNLMVTSLQQLIYENYEVNLLVKDIALKKREAELYALQNQINPHFLFNTLESIRMKLFNGEDTQEASGMIFNLSKILRMGLNWHGEIITLAKEIEFVKYYLEINKGRYKDKLNYSISLPDELLDCKILKLIVQPIVENSIKHGLEKKSRLGMISIYANESEGKLRIHIKDNGAGMDTETLIKIQKEIASSDDIKSDGSIGIKNVNDRIVLSYGKEYGLRIQSVLDEGTEVILSVPMKK